MNEEKYLMMKEGQERGKESADILTKGLNSFSSSGSEEVIKGFVSGITRTHRTLQQCSAHAIYALLKQWAEDYDNGCYDLRNEATCKWAKTIIDAVGTDYHFPFI